MEHSHPLPDAVALCPYCSTAPGTCCRVLGELREARRKRERRYYAKHPEASRARRLRSYHNRATKPPGASGPLDPPTAP